MKFLIYGNAPYVGTGYGVQIGHLCRKLTEHGHEVAVACTYGHAGHVRLWPTPHGNVTLYPQGILQNSLDVAEAHALHFFGGDPQGGVIIVVTDMFAMLSVAEDLRRFRVIAWTPVDHWPCPPEVLRFFHDSGALPVAMAEYGQRQLMEAGLPAQVAPLAVDTKAYKPTTTIDINGEQVTARQMFNIPESADFVAVMVAMNKDPMDRKNFNGALRAFGRFWRDHPNAYLHVHTDATGAYGSGLDLRELAKHAAIPPHAIGFTERYANLIGLSPEQMALLYTEADVLLCPSKGEGFGVPMIEAQACGTPVLASDFTAQTELVGAGWTVSGQLEFDQFQKASYLTPFTTEVYERLCDAYEAKGTKTAEAVVFARRYDVDAVWEKHWLPILAALEEAEPAADKPLMQSVDVLVPYMREANRKRLVESFLATRPDPDMMLNVAQHEGAPEVLTYAQNVNALLANSDADWVLVVGDDVEFTPGWFEAAVPLSDRYDVIGTNDSEPGRTRNPAVANGSHADHFFVRRSYIDNEGASLDGPGILAPECYQHWYVDREIIELAKARGVFAPCLESRIIHHHPGYDGNESARESDPLYMRAVEGSDADRRTWMQRAPIVAGYRGR